MMMMMAMMEMTISVSNNHDIIAIELIKLFRNSSIEIKFEIVINLLRPGLCKDKANTK